MLSITPRIIRAKARPSSDNTEFWYGTESRSGLAPMTQRGGARTGAGAGSGATGSAMPLGGSNSTNVSSMDSGATVGGAMASSGGAMAGAPVMASGGLQVSPSAKLAAISGVTEVPSAKPAEPDGPAPKLSTTLSGPAEVKTGDEFTVSFAVQSDLPLTHLRAQVRFDGAAFQLLGGDPGAAVPASAGAKVIGRTGGAQLDVNATADEPVSASGELMVLKFKALQARAQTAIAAQLSVMGGSGAIIASSTPTPQSVSVGN